MVKERDMTYRVRTAFARIASVLLMMMIAVMLASPGFAYAEETKQEEPIREVHNVGIGNSMYCFFVTHNVVLTPELIQEKTDEELISYIVEKSGLYMKETNCRLEKHKAISVADWTKKNGNIFFTEPELETVRAAEPVDGAPVKMYMDLMIAKESEKPADTDADTETDTEDGEAEEEAPYSTYKKISPELIFIAIATPTDAESGEDICEEEKVDPGKGVKPKKKSKKKSSIKPAPEPAEEEEILPEYRTINMADRSGDPIEETLKDGDPVYLEWIEPRKGGSEGEKSFFDRIPGGMTGAVAMTAAAAAAVAAIVFAAKRKKKDE